MGWFGRQTSGQTIFSNIKSYKNLTFFRSWCSQLWIKISCFLKDLTCFSEKFNHRNIWGSLNATSQAFLNLVNKIFRCHCYSTFATNSKYFIIQKRMYPILSLELWTSKVDQIFHIPYQWIYSGRRSDHQICIWLTFNFHRSRLSAKSYISEYWKWVNIE